MTTTTPQLTTALMEELKAVHEDKVAFPYGLTDDALAFLANQDDENWVGMRAQQEQKIREHGRTLVAIPQEDENGELVRHAKTGKVMVDFTYTLGQGRKGLPEVLCFYPSPTVGFAINRLCDKMEAGEVELDEDGIGKVAGCFDGNDELEFLLMPLTGDARKLAADKYACQCLDDEPLFLAVAPLPNGNYRQEFIPEGIL